MREIFIIILIEKLIEIEKIDDSLLNYFLYFYYYLNLSHYLYISHCIYLSYYHYKSHYFY